MSVCWVDESQGGYFSSICGVIMQIIMVEAIYNLTLALNYGMGWGSSVGIATRYGPDGPEIESRWRQDFPHLSRPAVGPTQPPIPGLSRG
jgi:hypothetical protein